MEIGARIFGKMQIRGFVVRHLQDIYRDCDHLMRTTRYVSPTEATHNRTQK